MVILVILVLAGCEQADVVPPPSSQYPAFDAAAAQMLLSSAEYHKIDLTTSEENGLRSQLGLQPLCVGSTSPACGSASTFELQNIHQAHAAKNAGGDFIRGKGQLIAIVDDGFRLGHREFVGKSISAYTGSYPLQVADHGTGVAAVAAGAADGNGIVGVAPDASLHLTSWASVPSGSNVEHIKNGTDAAATQGAVVQNNSWGWVGDLPVADEIGAFRSSGKTDYAQFITGRLGGTSSDWRNLFAAYDNFQRTGVIVYANSNDSAFSDAASWPALPLLVPELREAWVVVGNALISTNQNTGQILKADLISAPCGSAATFCVTTDGSVYAPTADGDNSYQIWTGTSFAAPQVAGQIALIAQAFPNLSPAEWAARMLATAKNGWPGFTDSVSGEVTFAPGVVRNVSRLYGLGVPDVAAALSPIGGLAIPTGATIKNAEAASIAGGVPASAPVIGNSLANAVATHRIMLLDRLGSDFYLNGSELGLTGSTRPATGTHAANQISRDVAQLSLGFAPGVGAGLATGERDVGTARLFFSQSQMSGRESDSFSSFYRLSEREAFHISGQISPRGSTNGLSFTIGRMVRRNLVSSELSFSASYQQDSLFSGFSAGPLLAADYTADFATGLSLNVPMGRNWSLTGFAEIGTAAIGSAAHSLVRFGPVAHMSTGLAAFRRDMFSTGDSFGLYAGARPTAVAGAADIRLPVSRDQSGQIKYDTIRAALVGTTVPVRMGVIYAAPTFNGFNARFSVNADFDMPDIGAMTASAAVSVKKSF